MSTSEALIDALSERHIAILLDNCEHVIDDVARVVDRLLDGTPEVHILVTSRIPLDLADEVRVSIPALATSAKGDEKPHAVEMFVACATRLGCSVDEQSLGEVRKVCERLDGLPLAIDIAAGSTPVSLSP